MIPLRSSAERAPGWSSLAVLFALLCVADTQGLAQTTQGLISGRAVDGRTDQPLAGAVVQCRRWGQGAVIQTRSSRTNRDGYYALASLSPGTYQIQVDAGIEYQPQEVYELDLPVA